MTYSLFSLVFIYVFVFKQPPCYLQMNLWKSKCKEVENVFTVLIMVYLFINAFVNDTLEGTMILNSQAIIHLIIDCDFRTARHQRKDSSSTLLAEKIRVSLSLMLSHLFLHAKTENSIPHVPGPCGKHRPKLSVRTRAEEKYVADILAVLQSMRRCHDPEATWWFSCCISGDADKAGGGGGAGTTSGQALIHDQAS